jgi:hypothetical protein
LTTEETAHALRCSSGTVKSQTARGLERLRTLLGSRSDQSVRPGPVQQFESTYQGENNHD